MLQRRIITEKTARYFLSGQPGKEIRHIFIVCHGYSMLANEFLENFKPLFRNDRLFVAPEGLHRFYPKGGSGRVAASWMTKEDRLDDIHDYVFFLDKVYDAVLAECRTSPRVSVLGFSQGAATVSRWAATGKSRIDELILWCGFFPPDLPPGGVPHHIPLTIVTASDDEYFDKEEEKKQLQQIAKLNPVHRHIRFTGKHEINIDTLNSLLG